MPWRSSSPWIRPTCGEVLGVGGLSWLARHHKLHPPSSSASTHPMHCRTSHRLVYRGTVAYTSVAPVCLYLKQKETVTLTGTQHRPGGSVTETVQVQCWRPRASGRRLGCCSCCAHCAHCCLLLLLLPAAHAQLCYCRATGVGGDSGLPVNVERGDGGACHPLHAAQEERCTTAKQLHRGARVGSAPFSRTLPRLRVHSAKAPGLGCQHSDLMLNQEGARHCSRAAYAAAL